MITKENNKLIQTKVKKFQAAEEIVSALKRINLFTKPWQKGKCILTFNENSVIILGENQDVNETIEVKLNGTPCRMVTSGEELLTILKKVDSNFTIYGSQKVIGFQDKYGLYVLSLMEEEKSQCTF